MPGVPLDCSLLLSSHLFFPDINCLFCQILFRFPNYHLYPQSRRKKKKSFHKKKCSFLPIILESLLRDTASPYKNSLICIIRLSLIQQYHYDCHILLHCFCSIFLFSPHLQHSCMLLNIYFICPQGLQAEVIPVYFIAYIR